MSDRFGRTIVNALLLVGGLALLWELLYLYAGEIALRSPWETIRYTRQLVATDMFWMHLSESLRAFAAALAIAAGCGLAIGFWLGFSRLAGEVFEPMLVALYSIPKITLYPIVLLAFGLGMPAKIAFGAIHGIIPIALFTINAVRNIKPVLIKTARVLRLGRGELIRSVLFPAAAPEIFTGFRLGFSLTLIGTLLGEMFAAQRGLGYLLMTAIGLHNVDVIMAVTFLLVVAAAAVSATLLAIDRRLHRLA
jgi:NitT/TauT family transport system permease protein